MSPVAIKPAADVVNQTYQSGTNVMTWNPIAENNQPDVFAPVFCTATPAVGLNANWQNPHNAFVLTGHPWAYDVFFAPWINSVNSLSSNANNPFGKGYNWTKYETQVSGNGSFVIQLMADNCSWVYLDGTLVGVQADDRSASKISYGLTLNGTHTLTFIIFDGGGAAGGKFLLQTTTNPPPPLNPDLDADGHNNDVDAFPLDPTEWVDTDHDGVGDNKDAFPADATEQADVDLDHIGDHVDNCPATANSDQADLDGDHIGDACDPDIDGDGVANADDAYPTDPARTLADADNDGVLDITDNCPAIANPSQTDIDGDHVGDACDTDIDGDGHLNADDAYPTDASRWQLDTDSDGVPDITDNCSTVSNVSQADLDGDHIGDACDSDIDGDGTLNASDVFPTNPAEWADSDHDGIGNNADPYDNSNTGPTIMVGTCNTNAANHSVGGGTWLNDLIAAAYSSAPNHGAFVSAVSDLADSWKKAGDITGRDQGAIVSCAARMK